jgi:hypothetical protein
MPTTRRTAAVHDASRASVPAHHQHPCVDAWPGVERSARKAITQQELERAGPPAISRRGRRRPSSCCLFLQDDTGGYQAAAGLEDAPQQRRANVEGKVRDHVVRPTRETQVACIALHDDDAAVERREPLSETIGTSGMPLDRDDACPRRDERRGQGSGTGADVDDDRVGREPRVSDETRGKLGLEPVPSPRP